MARPNTAAARLLSGSREPVLVATTANITLAGEQTIDAVAVEAGDRVLVMNQSDSSDNGIYTCNTGVWTRAPDARSTRTLNKGVTVRVQSGTAHGGELYQCMTLNPDIGDDPLIFAVTSDGGGGGGGGAEDMFGNLGAIFTGKNMSTPAEFLDANNYIDSRLYGVVGDGVTANATALNAALAAAAAMTYRCRVILPAGTVNIGSKITIPQGVVLEGQGAALVWGGIGAVKYGTRIKWTGSTTTGTIFDSSSSAVVHDWGIKNLTIDGGVAQTEPAIQGSQLKAIVVRSGFYQKITNVSIQLVGIGISFEPNFALGGSNNLIEWGEYRDINMFCVNVGIVMCVNCTLSDLTAGGTTNNQFFNINMYQFMTRAWQFCAMADDNRVTGGHALTSVTNAIGIEFNSLDPTGITGVYGNTFMNYEIQGDGSAEYGIVSGNTGYPDAVFGNSFIGGALFIGTPFVRTNNAVLVVSTDTGIWCQEYYKPIQAATGIIISNDADHASASAVIDFRTNAGNTGLIQANSTTNTAYGNTHSFNIINRLNAKLCLGTFDQVRMTIGSAGAVTMHTYGAGTLSTNSSGLIAASDEALKNIIKGQSKRYGLAEIMMLDPILFEYKTTPGVRSWGMSAQNVQRAIPEAIGHIPGDDDDPEGTTYLNIDDRAIIATMINAIKELNAKVEELTGRLQ